MFGAQRSGNSQRRRAQGSSLIAWLFLGCACASAQAQDVPAHPAPAALTQEIPANTAAPEPGVAEPDGLQPEATDAPPPAADAGLAPLQLKLQNVKDERAHTTNLLPWLSVGVGTGAVLIGASAGAVHVFGCEDSCRTPSWVTIAIVAGATVATLGAIWVLHRDANIRELDSQRYQLEQELLRLQLSRQPYNGASADARSTFSWRFSL